MDRKGNTIRIESVKTLFVPVDVIRKIIHFRNNDDTIIYTDRGITHVLDDYAELAAALPDLCEEV